MESSAQLQILRSVTTMTTTISELRPLSINQSKDIKMLDQIVLSFFFCSLLPQLRLQLLYSAVSSHPSTIHEYFSISSFLSQSKKTRKNQESLKLALSITAIYTVQRSRSNYYLLTMRKNGEINESKKCISSFLPALRSPEIAILYYCPVQMLKMKEINKSPTGVSLTSKHQTITSEMFFLLIVMIACFFLCLKLNLK